MEPSLPTSFIPKRPVSSEDFIARPTSHAVGLVSLLTGAIVVATAVAFAGVYLYGTSLENQKGKLQQNITEAKDGLGTDFVSDMKRLSGRIEGVKTLIKSHIVVSPIFSALAATTLQSVEYGKFDYSFENDATTKSQIVEVNLSGNAKSYATIALQSDAFAQAKLIKNPVFSNLTIDDKTGRVGFNLQFTVTPSDLSYQTFVDSKGAANMTAPQTAPPATTTPATQIAVPVTAAPATQTTGAPLPTRPPGLPQ